MYFNYENMARKLYAPKGLVINFKPSVEQMAVWESLMPNHCDKCHQDGLEIKQTGYDEHGNPIHEVVCSHCGNTNISENILQGGAAGGGKSYLGCVWLASSCIRFPGILMAVARLTLKSLRETTWATLLRLLGSWGLKEDVHYHINNQYGYLEFWNKSVIQMVELAPSLKDPDYNSLGSLEITGAFIDELSEIPEKAAEVLASRIRFKVAETFVVGKICASTNPCLGWVRSTYVIDDDLEPVKLQKGYRYHPFTVFSNPDEKFRQIYINRLRKIRDKATRERLLYGNWVYPSENSMAAYWNFDGEKNLAMNVKEKHFDPLRPVILSLDFNVNPYMSCLCTQIDYDNKCVYVFPEYVGYSKDKLNNTPAFSRHLVNAMRTIRACANVILTGDPAGRARSTQTEDGVNNFTILSDEFKRNGFRVSTKLFDKQPSQVTRLEFVNELLNGYEGWQILIDVRCRRLTEDLTYQKKNPDGTKEKKKVQMEGGEKAEKYGHLSDCLDYVLTYFLRESYNRYRNGSSSSMVATVSGSGQVYDAFGY